MNSPREQAIHSVLVSLFEAGELERFARHEFGDKVLRDIGNFKSANEQASHLVELLVDLGLINERFFQALHESRPDRAKDIERARADYFREDPPEETKADEPLEGAVETERTKWRQRMESILSTDYDLQPKKPSQSWVAAAAVLPHFNPAKLRPLANAEGSSKNALVLLAGLCDTLSNGRWTLHMEPRQESLAKLWNEDRILEALDANPDEVSEYTEFLRRLVVEGPVPVREISGLSALQAAGELAEWFQRSDFTPFDLDVLTAVTERLNQIGPLQRLTGTHFRGRTEELALLQAHLSPDCEKKILILSGTGGVGKSTLLGKFLLDIERNLEPVPPWIYLDFDDPEVEASRPRRLLELIARQLSLLYASKRDSADTFIGIESAAADDRALSFTMDIEKGATTRELLRALDKSIQELDIPELSLLVVLDTFEQVQVRGRHAVASIRSFLDKLLEILPYSRVIVSGRAAAGEWKDTKQLVLENLDDESADEVLSALGVEDAELRKLVVQKLGNSPLSLRLAAEAIDRKQLHRNDIENLVREAQRFELQGQLYTRILGHITDGEVRRLAHPGLIVRRMTPGVIRDVLASLCEIDPNQAEAIFQRLPDHVALFEPDKPAPGEDDALRHRQDVRETMLRLMMSDPGWYDKIEEIHSAAIDHYSGLDDHPILRAEEIYHRLMRNDDPADLDLLWTGDKDESWVEEVVTSLGRCWDEPLPDRARAWLGPRIGRTHGDHADWRTADWEVSAQREAKAHMASKDYDGALAALRGRDDRRLGSPLLRLEVESLIRLKRWDEARSILESAVSGALEFNDLREVLRLHIVGAELALASEDPALLKHHTVRAAGLADELENETVRLRALELQVSGDRTLGPSVDAEENARALEMAYARTDNAELLKEADVSTRILDLMGAQSKSVLKKAAQTFGNRSTQDVLNTDAYVLEDLLKHAQNTKAGRKQLSKLARQVGLSDEKFDLVDLAGSAIRYNRMGDAIAAVLDHAGDDEAVRGKTMTMLKRKL